MWVPLPARRDRSGPSTPPWAHAARATRQPPPASAGGGSIRRAAHLCVPLPARSNRSEPSTSPCRSCDAKTCACHGQQGVRDGRPYHVTVSRCAGPQDIPLLTTDLPDGSDEDDSDKGRTGPFPTSSGEGRSSASPTPSSISKVGGAYSAFWK